MTPNIPRFGLFAIFFAGILVATLLAILFGTIMFISQLNLFLALAYLVRFMEGFSMAVLWSTVLAILLASHPKRPAAVYALIDTTYGLGQSLGPVFGSFMFSISGFLLPFCICGAAILPTGTLSLPLIARGWPGSWLLLWPPRPSHHHTQPGALQRHLGFQVGQLWPWRPPNKLLLSGLFQLSSPL